MGQFNALNGTSTSAWVSTDPLLEVGNGASAGAPNDAMIVYKDGTVALGSTTSVAGYELTTNGGEYATQTNNGYAGVAGLNSSTSGSGYGGYFSATTTGAGFGVAGSMAGIGNTGYAGYFTNTSTGVVNYGLYASTSSATGWAGYFQGPVNVAGNITVTSCTTAAPCRRQFAVGAHLRDDDQQHR